MFAAKLDVLLYDLTSTYFETDIERGEKELRQFGYSRDKRSDCRQVVIALIVTPEGYPLSYEVLSGNTRDTNPLADAMSEPGWLSELCGCDYITGGNPAAQVAANCFLSLEQEHHV